ncbi:MAG TPA: ABC transporter substrate-binding protein [Candidatus Acidoferrales bacterium]|nr:ABC transporter substrate-binding protein [Candidatus Acidoferrales bacterium]
MLRPDALSARAAVFVLCFCFGMGRGAPGRAAAPSPALLKAKQEAEAKGWIFVASHDEIVAKAKAEGRLRALFGLDAVAIKALVGAFTKKYPFIETHVEEIEGTDAYQRFILEMKSGRATQWDATFIPIDFYKDYLPFQKKFDVLGMASHGVLSIDPRMVDPFHRNTVASTSIVQVIAYNKNLLPPERVPARWEDLLKPEFKGKKFIADIRPHMMAALVPAWGLEKVLDFSRRLAEQQPVWVRGSTRLLSAMIAGEYSLMIAPNLNSVKRAQEKDKAGVLAYRIVEPVPTRVVPRADAVLAAAAHPHAALLWIEFQASADAQKLIDQYGPSQASLFTPGSFIEQETRGRQLSVVDWPHAQKLEEYSSAMVKAYGFPKAER